jgi:hypothetical protein
VLHSVQPADAFELALLDPHLRRHLGLVAAHLLDEAFGVLASDEYLELDAEREVGREGIVNDGLDDYGDTTTRSSSGDKLPAQCLSASVSGRTVMVMCFPSPSSTPSGEAMLVTIHGSPLRVSLSPTLNTKAVYQNSMALLSGK